MKTIKVKFVDFWENFDPQHNFIANINIGLSLVILLIICSFQSLDMKI